MKDTGAILKRSLIVCALMAFALSASAELPSLTITESGSNSGGVAILKVRSPRPLSDGEMRSATHAIARQEGYSAAQIIYFVPPPPEKASYMDSSWRGKAKLYPNGDMRIIGGR